jgi:hypothetical protein
VLQRLHGRVPLGLLYVGIAHRTPAPREPAADSPITQGPPSPARQRAVRVSVRYRRPLPVAGPLRPGTRPCSPAGRRTQPSPGSWTSGTRILCCTARAGAEFVLRGGDPLPEEECVGYQFLRDRLPRHRPAFIRASVTRTAQLAAAVRFCREPLKQTAPTGTDAGEPAGRPRGRPRGFTAASPGRGRPCWGGCCEVATAAVHTGSVVDHRGSVPLA